MNTNSTNSGFFSKIGNALTGAVKTVTNVAAGKKNNSVKNNIPKNINIKNNTRKSMNVASNSMNVSNTALNQTALSPSSPIQSGGMAPVGFQYPPNMRQPSDAVMEWATTAGIPTPLSGMRNVAHGGKRKTYRKRRILRKKRSMKRKSVRNIKRRN
jgi:hypothetical protein